MKAADWLDVTRADRLKGGGILTPRLHTLGGDGGVLGPSPSFFSELVQNGLRGESRGKYDPVNIRQFSQGSFAQTGVLRFGLSLSDREQTERPFEENFVVRSGLRAFASGINSMPFELWDGPPADDTSSKFDDHPLLSLLSRPNRMESGAELSAAHTINYKHDGEVFWFLMNQDGEPVQVNEATGKVTEFPKQLACIRGDRVQHKLDDSGFPAAFRYSVPGGRHSSEFPWIAVIHFREYDPYNPVRGLGDVRALMREIDLMFQAYRYLDAAVKNGGDPGGFIVFEESLGQHEIDARQAEVDDTYTAENAGRYKVLDRKAKFTPNPTKPRDMEYLSLFEWTLKAICAGIGTPPPIIGWFDDASYNNLDGARRQMWAGPLGILPHCAARQDVLRTKLIDRLDATKEMRGQAGEVFPYWNPSGIEALKKDRTDALLKAAQTAGAGVGVSFNEALAMAELEVEPASEGDRVLLHSSLRDVSDPSPAATAAAGAASSKSKQEERSENGGRWVEMPSRRDASSASPKIKKRAKDWLTRYEKQILARLRVFANGGRRPSSRKMSTGDQVKTRVNSAKLTEEDVAGLVLNEAQWTESLAKLMKVPLSEVYAAGLASAKEVVGGPFVGVTNPKVLEAVAEQNILLSEGVTSATSRKVRSAILRVLSGIEPTVASLRELIKANLPALTKELKAVFGSKDARALAISVTETNGATEAANFIQMGEAGVATKRWKIQDDNARDTHKAQAAAGAIPYEQAFPNGGQYPLDPALPAGERVNCRCKLLAETFDDDLLDDE